MALVIIFIVLLLLYLSISPKNLTKVDTSIHYYFSTSSTWIHANLLLKWKPRDLTVRPMKCSPEMTSLDPTPRLLTTYQGISRPKAEVPTVNISIWVGQNPYFFTASVVPTLSEYKLIHSSNQMWQWEIAHTWRLRCDHHRPKWVNSKWFELPRIEYRRA